MKPITWRPGEPAASNLLGAVVAHDVRTADQRKLLLRKGEILDREGLERLQLAAAEVHLLCPEAGELHENEAGARLARAVAGPGVAIRGLVGAQYQMVAEHRGLFCVDQGALRAINLLEGLTVFTRFDRQPVEQGDLVAAAKCTPFLISEQVVLQAEAVGRRAPVARVLAYRPLRVGVLLLERVSPSARERFIQVLHEKLGYFGGSLGTLVEASQREEEIVPALRRLLSEGHDVVMLAGASSLDPLEPLFPSLRKVGAEIVKHGTPAHPGSLFWIAYADARPMFGLSSCEMFSRKTVLDLILPRVFAGESVDRETLVELGYGGLLEAGMDWRFPHYRESGAGKR